jgi:MFS family permease
MLLLAAAGVIIFVGLRPDPRELAATLVKLEGGRGTRQQEHRPLIRLLALPAVRLAIGAMVLGQTVMVLVMVITSLHMRINLHPLREVSFVISGHTFGMYAFSVFTGKLADRWGRGTTIAAGSLLLLLSCLAAPLSTELRPLIFSLFFLGLGWNLCFVAGSALLSDQLAASERCRMQGFNDLLVGLPSAIAGLSSGLIFASAGYQGMAWIGALHAGILMLAVLYWLRRTSGFTQQLIAAGGDEGRLL